jgi:hypothetical protein
VLVEVVSEAHDAKTCTGCGHLNDVGAAHVVRCTCRLEIDTATWRGQNIGLRSACARSTRRRKSAVV